MRRRKSEKGKKRLEKWNGEAWVGFDEVETKVRQVYLILS